MTDIYALFESCKGATTSLRNINNYDMFVSLHNQEPMIKAALSLGAKYVITSKDCMIEDARIIKVTNVRNTVIELAKTHRRNLQSLNVIGVTGTCGKTTTRRLISAVLSRKYNVVSTPDNGNGILSNAMTILKCNKDTDFAVLEIGGVVVNGVSRTCEVVKPNYGVISKIGVGHLLGYKTPEDVKRGKSALYKSVQNNNGIIFINQSDELLVQLIQELRIKNIVKYNLNPNDINIISSFPNLRFDINSYGVITSPLIGVYNINNILAAISIGEYFNVSKEDILNAIANCHSGIYRSSVIYKGTNVFVIDTYNSNPTSASASIKSFSEIKTDKEKVLILGDMKELGVNSVQYHTDILSLAENLGFKKCILIGTEYSKIIDSDFNISIKHFTTVDEFIESNPVFNNNIVLIKGSRVMKLEKIVYANKRTLNIN